MLIKVCGMRDADNIRAVEALGIDLMGFIFYDKSKRNVSATPAYLPASCQRVGVFVNATPDVILSRVSEFGLTYVQLHGDESLSFVRQLRQRLAADIPHDVRIVRSVAVASGREVQNARMWDGFVDVLLFETPSTGYGGSGVSFDWNLLSSYQGQTPFLIAGGIGMDCIDQLRQFSHQRWLGIDLNSRFEIEPAVKDIAKLQQFINSIKS